MNVISNNCCGGMFYKMTHRQYNNPFIWMVCPYDSIYRMLTRFTSINWANIKLNESTMKPNTYVLTVDNQVDIHYVHYMFNPNATTLITRSNSDTPICEWHSHREYCRIWEYIIDRYRSRVRRMIDCGKEPVFLLRDEDYAQHVNGYSMKDLSESDSKYKRFIITTDKTCNRNDTVVKTIHPDKIERPYLTVSKYLSTFNSFMQGVYD